MKLKKFLPSFLLFISTIFIPQVICAEPMNLADLKNQVIIYYESGAYQKEVSQIVAQARDYLQARIADNNKLSQPKKLAIVLDIDETALSNFGNLRILNFGCTVTEVMQHAAKGKNAVIAPTLNLYRYAKQHGVAVFFVSGRKEEYRTITELNLRNAGYYDWDAVILKPMSYAEKSHQPFKVAIRKDLVKNHGYDIVLNMGDQVSDLAGGYADKTFKLPNPFYLLP